MKTPLSRTALLVIAAFAAGLLTHLLYQRWSGPAPDSEGYPVAYSPLPAPAARSSELPLLEARDVEKIRGHAGQRARIRGRVFRVGHSARSNTYFLNFGPSRNAFTGVIFASALPAFERANIRPQNYQGKDLELTGEIKDHPKYGLEMILEDPSQVKVLE